MYKILIFIFLFIFLIPVTFFIKKYFFQSNHIGGPYYFETFVSYSLPKEPIKEISYDKAQELLKSGNSYYEAYYDEFGKLIKISKYFNGNIIFEEKYFYSDYIFHNKKYRKLNKVETKDGDEKVKKEFYK